MSHRAVCVLALVTSVLTPAATGPVASAFAAARTLHHGPDVELAVPGAAATATSTNWSGIAAASLAPMFTSVRGEWVVPRVICKAGENSYSSTWAGIGIGSAADPLFQNGTGSNCVNGRPTYYAWWEEFPLNAEQRFSYPVVPGDPIRSDVIFTGGQAWLSLVDQKVVDGNARWSTGWLKLSDSHGSHSVECIVERPTLNKTLPALADFQRAQYQVCQDSNTSSQNGFPVIPGQPIPGAVVQAITMVNASKDALAVPSQFLVGGFRDTWLRAS